MTTLLFGSESVMGPGGEEAERSGQDSEGMAVPPLPYLLWSQSFIACSSPCAFPGAASPRVSTAHACTLMALSPVCQAPCVPWLPWLCTVVHGTHSVTDKDRGQACESGVVKKSSLAPHPLKPPPSPRGGHATPPTPRKVSSLASNPLFESSF